MLSITDGGSLSRALSSSIDPILRDIIKLRVSQLRRDFDGPLEEIVNFIIVEPGEGEREVADALGFSPLQNVVDGARFGDPDFTPSWEWAGCHGRWFELVYILSDDGFGIIVFVPDDPSIEFDLHALCLEHICG